jgi:hypothetical protein
VVRKSLKVAVGLSFFDNLNEIPRCLGNPNNPKALCNRVDHIIAINGRYDGYEADHNYSIDGSREYIQTTYHNSIVDDYWGYQPKKRQRYLDIAGELGCDFLIVVDSDEFVHPSYDNWISFYANLKRISLKYKDYRLFRMKLFLDMKWTRAFNYGANRNKFKNVIRIHKDPGNQRYCMESHFMWCDKKTTDEMLVTGKGFMFGCYNRAIDGMRLATDSTLRNEETLRLRDQWAWNSIHEERKREYVLKAKYLYPDLKGVPPLDKFLKYDKQGRPIVQ